MCITITVGNTVKGALKVVNTVKGAKCLERKYPEIVELKLEDCQCGFCPGRSTTDQIFTLRQIFEKSWEYAKDVFACFVDLEKAYDQVP